MRHAAGWSITLIKTLLPHGRLVGRSFADMLHHNILSCSLRPCGARPVRYSFRYVETSGAQRRKRLHARRGANATLQDVLQRDRHE